MPTEKRRFIRFSIDIPAVRFTKYGEALGIMLNQISVGGGFAIWDDDILVGEEFRVLIQLPNRNWLPLNCKVLYRFTDNGIGLKFSDITQFEQELISKIILRNLETQGLPFEVNPLGTPVINDAPETEPKITDKRLQKDGLLDDILSFGN